MEKIDEVENESEIQTTNIIEVSGLSEDTSKSALKKFFSLKFGKVKKVSKKDLGNGLKFLVTFKKEKYAQKAFDEGMSLKFEE